MPFLTFDPRDYGCYDGVEIPEDVHIPTTDIAAWAANPEHGWAYNRLEVARRQGLRCGPMELTPAEYPVFVKPVYNFRGGGVGARLVESQAAFDAVAAEHPEMFWTEMLVGNHRSADFVLHHGDVVFLHVFDGKPIGGGMFDYWETVRVSAAERRDLIEWAEATFPGYTGALNAETIDGAVIETHLRMGDIDRCASRGWLQSLIELHAGKPWQDVRVQPFVVMTLFGAHDTAYVFDEEFLVHLSAHATTCSDETNEEGDVSPPGGRRILCFSMTSKDEALEWRQRAIVACSPPLAATYTSPLELPPVTT